MSSWQTLGEGFTTTDRKSFGSKDKVSHQQSNQVSSSKWKSINCMSSFSFPSKEAQPEKNDISWSDSSSEDEVSVGTDKFSIITPQNRRKKRVPKREQSSANKNKRPAVGLVSWTSKHVKSDLKTENEGRRDLVAHSHSSSKILDTKQPKKNIKDIDLSLDSTVLNTDDKSRFVSKSNKTDQQAVPNANNNIEAVENKSRSNISKWSVSSFEYTDGLKPSQPHDKRKNNRQIHEEICIDESASGSSGSERGDTNDVEGNVDETDVEDIASDASVDSVAYQNVSQSLSPTESAALPHERVSQQDEIASVSSLSSGSCANSLKVGASDWAVRFQKEVSPDSKMKADVDDFNKHDSAKKKQRYSSKSLVGQLSRLIRRENSTVRFWQHSSAKGNWNEDSSQKCVTLRIESLVKEFSLYVAQCRVIEDTNSLLPAKRCQLMLVRGHADKMAVQTGNTIELFPPWKQMDQLEKTIILCAKKVRVVPTELILNSEKNVTEMSLSTPDQKGDTVTTNEDIVTFRWTCPCKQNLSIQSEKCPAYSSDHFTKFFSRMALQDKTRPPTSKHPSYHSNLRLHSVQSATPPPASPSVHRSLLQSIQDVRTGVDCMPPFTATVLRVFRRNIVSQSSVRLSVLLEDCSGHLALIEHEDMDEPSYHALWVKLYNMMEIECLCQGLTLVTRRTREKDPLLFQVIASAWRVAKVRSSDSQENSQISQVAQKMPSFCYILHCVGETNTCLRSISTDGEPELDHSHTTFGQIIKDKNYHQRFSCAVKVIDVQDSIQSSSERCSSLFVCDPYHVGVGQMTQFYPLNVTGSCIALDRLKDRKSHICLLQDVIWDKGMICADEFSTLLPQLLWHSLGIDKVINKNLVGSISSHDITAPILGNSSSSDYFVRVSGQIVHINEDKCYSWEGCRRCGVELITTDDTRMSHCPRCQKDESHPETRMSMEVNILEDSLKDFLVKIDLSQRTITSLLPDEVPNEGFDIDLVLGKSICAVAFVVDRTIDTIQLYQVDL